MIWTPLLDDFPTNEDAIIVSFLNMILPKALHMDKTRNCTFTASNFNRDDLEHFTKALDVMGIPITCDVSTTGKTARVNVEVPASLFDAKSKRTRFAGRRSQGINPPHSSIFNCDTPCKDFLSWQKNHTVAEGMEQLGLSRATFFRRMKSMRAIIEEYDLINANRDRSSEWKDGPRLVARLKDVR